MPIFPPGMLILPRVRLQVLPTPPSANPCALTRFAHGSHVWQRGCTFLSGNKGRLRRFLMKKTFLRLRSFLALFTLVSLFSLVTANAQQSQPQGGTQSATQDNDTTRGELASFDRFMDAHPEIAEQLRRDPSLVKNEDFVRNHRDLQEYLQQHPGAREEITENPDRFMRQEQRYDRREDRRDSDQPESRRDEDRRDFNRPEGQRDEDRRDNDTTRGELASFDRFMDGHPEIAEQLRRDPSLAKNQDFVRNHPALQEYLQQHPGTREEISENPDRFMHQEQRFDRIEDNRNPDMSHEHQLCLGY